MRSTTCGHSWRTHVNEEGVCDVALEYCVSEGGGVERARVLHDAHAAPARRRRRLDDVGEACACAHVSHFFRGM